MNEPDVSRENAASAAEASLSGGGGGWRTGNPPEHGYYLGAWKRGGSWTVSELWFNPDSIGSGWWSTRGYLNHRDPGYPETVPVEAWMPMPAYRPANTEGAPRLP